MHSTALRSAGCVREHALPKLDAKQGQTRTDKHIGQHQLVVTSAAALRRVAVARICWIRSKVCALAACAALRKAGAPTKGSLAQRVRRDGVACAVPEHLLDACAVASGKFVYAKSAISHAFGILVYHQAPLRGIRCPHGVVLHSLDLHNLHTRITLASLGMNSTERKALTSSDARTGWR